MEYQMKVTLTTEQFHELQILMMYHLILNVDNVQSENVKDILIKLKNTVMTYFQKAFLQINPERRIQLKRILPALDGDLKTNAVITILPEKNSIHEKEKTKGVNKVMKKLLNKDDISLADLKLLREMTNFDVTNTDVKNDKFFMKYLR